MFRTGLLLTATELVVRCVGVVRCRRFLIAVSATLPRRGWVEADRRSQAQRVANMVDIAKLSYSVYPAECLTRGLVLEYLLSRYGIDGKLVIGTRTLFEVFDAHAWVEVDGEALNEKEQVRRIYAPFEISGTR